MQPENDKKFTDGERLVRYKSATGKTWEQVAAAILWLVGLALLAATVRLMS